MLRPLATLLIFFGLLFYFQAPLKQIPGQFSQLHSPYVSQFRDIFNTILRATSSSFIGGYKNYIPGLSSGASSTLNFFGSSTNGVNSYKATSSTSTTVAITSKGNSVAGSEASSNTKPLVPVTSNQQEGYLAADIIISATNKERVKMGLPKLVKNQKLLNSAEIKLEDMFSNQYFAHVSPSGESVSTVVSRAGYDYIVVGENLALGLFPNDEAVVAAWMASPGHKKNILDSRYQEIGVAVGQGMYQGRKQWLIVQHFGKPLSSCQSPNADLKNTITEESKQLSIIEQRITSAKTEVDNAMGTSEYGAKVDAYNTLVNNYNQSREELRLKLEVYNKGVKAFNDCIAIES